jgi:hypothetical protein
MPNNPKPAIPPENWDEDFQNPHDGKDSKLSEELNKTKKFGIIQGIYMSIGTPEERKSQEIMTDC